MELRDYQQEHVEGARSAIASGKRRLILQGATGSGKTIVAASISTNAVMKGNNVLFLVNKRDLVYQARDRFESFGLGGHVGLIMAGEEPNHLKPIKIGTIQTYHRRLKIAEPQWNAWYHKAQVVIIDEAHSSVCRTYMDVIKTHKQDAVILGLTATPCRADGRGLGAVFEDIIPCRGVSELTTEGHLVPMVYYVPDKPDLSKLHTVRGDYDKKELGKKMDKPKLIGNIYEQWARLASDRQTIIFAVNVKHSINIMREFERRGVSVAHVDAHTKQEDREVLYEDFRAGSIQVLTNVGIATEGSDFPSVSCVSIARPTKSFGLWMQMAGRGMRPSEGKSDCILIDHAGCYENHGFVDQDIAWTLADQEKAWKKPEKKKREKRYLSCDMCSHLFHGPRCPECGYEVENYGQKIASIEADLVKVGKTDKKKMTMDEKRRWYAMLEFERRARGYAMGWLAHKYREKTGVWPRGMDSTAPVEPDEKCKNWLTYQRIKWAKSKNNQREAVA